MVRNIKLYLQSLLLINFLQLFPVISVKLRPIESLVEPNNEIIGKDNEFKHWSTLSSPSKSYVSCPSPRSPASSYGSLECLSPLPSPPSSPERFQITKTRQKLHKKICEIDWSHFRLQQFDKFFKKCSAFTYRKRK